MVEGIVRRALRYAGLAVMLAVWLNLGWLFIERMIAGDVSRGYEAGGHYFVWVKPGFAEVSQGTWDWLRFHGDVTLASMPLAVAGGVLAAFAESFRRKVSGTATPGETARRAEAVRVSGPVLDAARCRAKLGSVLVEGPLAMVRVYSGGIILKPIAMSEHVVLASEIDGCVKKHGRFGWDLEITHAGVDMPSPLRLDGTGVHVRSAIMRIAAIEAHRRESDAEESS